MPLISLDHVTTAFGHVPLLDDAGMQVEAGERIAVIGRNGSGKSTLLRVPLDSPGTVFDAVADGLCRGRDSDPRAQYGSRGRAFQRDRRHDPASAPIPGAGTAG